MYVCMYIYILYIYIGRSWMSDAPGAKDSCVCERGGVGRGGGGGKGYIYIKEAHLHFSAGSGSSQKLCILLGQHMRS
jgi:hypothetical protein